MTLSREEFMKRKYREGIIFILLVVLYVVFFCPHHYGQKISLFSPEGENVEAELDLYLFRNRLDFSRQYFDGFQIAAGDIMCGTFTVDGEVYEPVDNFGKHAFSQDGVYSFITRKNGGTERELNEVYAWIDFSGGLDSLRIRVLDAGFMREYYNTDVPHSNESGKGKGL